MTSEINQTLVVFVALQTGKRTSISKLLRSDGYQSDFVDDLKTAADRLATERPGVVVHNWGGIDPSQSIKFQRQITCATDLVGICRIVYAEVLTPQLLALVSDCGITRVVCHAATLLHLATEIKMAHTLTRNLTELHILARKFRGGGEYNQYEVDQAIKRAHAAYPNDPGVTSEFGNLMARSGRLPEARQIAEKLIEENPANVRAMNLLGRVILASGQIDEAIAVLKAADLLSPLDGERLLLLGEAFLQKGDSTGAAKAYGEALLSDPEAKEAKKGLAMAKLREGDINAAVELFRQSVSEDEAVGLFNNAAVIATKNGNQDQGIALYRAALLAARSNELKSVIHYNLAISYERHGDGTKCREHLDLAVKINPKNDKARRKRSRA